MSTVILACSSLLDNVEAAQKKMGTSYPVVQLDKKYHVEPSDMRKQILKTLEELPEEVDTVLVAMGFCGGSWQDVTATRTLVMPRVADCIALSLVTPDRFDPDLKEAGHLYLVGDGSNGFSVRSIRESLLEQYRPRIAEVVFHRYFDSYHHLDMIDNGLYDCYDPDYVERAQEDADAISAELAYVPGSNVMLEALVSGCRDARFLVVPPGTAITQGYFYE